MDYFILVIKSLLFKGGNVIYLFLVEDIYILSFFIDVKIVELYTLLFLLFIIVI